MNRLISLAAIEVFIWAILLGSALLISKVVFAINLGTSSLPRSVVTELTRFLVSAAIILAWLVVWKKVTDSYFWRTLSRRRLTS